MLISNYDKRKKKVEIIIQGEYFHVLEELIQLTIHCLQEFKNVYETEECKK